MSSLDVTDAVWLFTLRQYVTVSAIALYGYDYLITLPREVILLWGKKMGLGAGAYLVARLSLGTCVQTILVLRTYAISQSSLSTLIGLSVLAIISVIPGSRWPATSVVRHH
ncbi:hypothetical protein JB92DRAFT_417704 [Gautieria morchelliformis]|nr:hypothetical protein JB92DRAFT_417704 [Gautieria morchelliformis]